MRMLVNILFSRIESQAMIYMTLLLVCCDRRIQIQIFVYYFLKRLSESSINLFT